MSHTSNDDTVVLPTTRPVLAYDGKISELYGIFLLNLLLTIVTLGIYRFWAITRIRRYLWSHMRFQGTRFTYTGRGGELFVGFLLAMLLLAALVAVTAGLAYLAHQVHPALVAVPIVAAYILAFILFGAALYSAQRYRLSRTEWRGLRGGMSGSALRYGVAVLLYTLGTIFTLYQLVPWMQVGLARRRINASQFGSARFRFEGRGGALWPSWIATLLGNVALLAAVGAICGALAWPILQPVILEQTTGPEAQVAMLRVLPIAVIGLLVFGLLAGLLSLWYFARLARMIMGGTSLDTLRFRSTVTARGLLWLGVSNTFLALITLGFGLPIVLHRIARFIARNTLVTGQLRPETLAQNGLASPRTGEGLLQAFDPGIV